MLFSNHYGIPLSIAFKLETVFRSSEFDLCLYLLECSSFLPCHKIYFDNISWTNTLIIMPGFHQRPKQRKRKRKRNTLTSPSKRVNTSVSSTEAETERMEHLLFLPAPFLLPLSFPRLCCRENGTQKQEEKSLILCVPLAFLFHTSLVNTRLYCEMSRLCVKFLFKFLQYYNYLKKNIFHWKDFARLALNCQRFGTVYRNLIRMMEIII